MKYIIGNWKMNPADKKEATSLMEEISAGIENFNLSDIYVGAAVPFPFLDFLNASKIKIGAQNVFWKNFGAFTGEVSPRQIKSVGADFVVLGHSERRIYMKENNEIISKKITAALAEGLKVVLCVGEPREIRDKGDDLAQKYTKEQIKECLAFQAGEENRENGEKMNKNLIIAYEPIWAISTFNKGAGPAKPEEIGKMAQFIKKTLDDLGLSPFPVIYGGSVDLGNIEEFIKQPAIEGCLPGGASLKAEDFVGMVKIVVDS